MRRQGGGPEELLESALVANIHRSALPELDEARALQRLLSIHGSQAALAKRLHKSQGWISQRLALLNLTPELQEKVGQEPIKFLRAVGNRPKEEQAAALEELKRKAAEEKEKTEAVATATSALSTAAGTAEPLEATAREPLDARQPQAGDGPGGHYGAVLGDRRDRHPVVVGSRITSSRGFDDLQDPGDVDVQLHQAARAPECVPGRVASTSPNTSRNSSMNR